MPEVVVGLLLLWVLFGSLSQGMGDVNDQWSRVSWIAAGAGLLVASQAPTPWAAWLIGACSIGVMWHMPMSLMVRETLAPSLALAGAYVVAAPHMRPWMVPWGLGALATVGAWTGIWALYSIFQPVDHGYDHRILKGWVRFHDRDGGAPLAGQGNFNHAQSVGALAAAAGVGLLWLGHWWAVPLLLLSIAGVLLSTEGRMTGKWMSQGILHLTWLGLIVGGLFIGGILAWSIWVSSVGVVFFYAHPWRPRQNWVDSGRFAAWNLALREIWWTATQPTDPARAIEFAQQEWAHLDEVQRQASVDGVALVHNQMTVMKSRNEELQRRWRVLLKQRQGEPLTTEERRLAWQLWTQRLRIRLLGCGTGSWYPLTKWPALMRTGAQNPVTKKWEGRVYLSAHNEYVELLFEQGLLGLAAGLGLVAYGLWTAWTGGALGHAVLLPVMALLSIAFTNFPFSLFREVEPQPDVPPQFVGCPALLVMSLLVLLLVEAVR